MSATGARHSSAKDRLLIPNGVNSRDHFTQLTRANHGKGSVDWQHTAFPDGTFPDGSFFVDLLLYDPADPTQPFATYVLGGYADFPQPRIEHFAVDLNSSSGRVEDFHLAFDLHGDFAVTDTAYGHALWVVAIDEDTNKVLATSRLKKHVSGPLQSEFDFAVKTDKPFTSKTPPTRLAVKAALMALGSEVPANAQTEPEFRIVDPEGQKEGAVVARSKVHHLVGDGFAIVPEKPKRPASDDEVLVVWVDRATGLDGFGAAILLLSGRVIPATARTSLGPGDYELRPDIARKTWSAGSSSDFKLEVEGLDPFTFPYHAGKTRLHITNGLAYPLPGRSIVETSYSCEGFMAPYYRIDYRNASPGARSEWVRVNYDDGISDAWIDIDVVHDIGDEEVSLEDAKESWRQGHVGPVNRWIPKRMNKTTTPRLWTLRRAVLDALADDFFLQSVVQGKKVVEFVISIEPFPGGMSFGRSYRSSYTTSSRTHAFKEIIDEARWSAAGSLRDRAAAWKWAWRNPRGTVAVAKARNLKTGEVKEFVATNGSKGNPFGQHWANHKNAREEFVQGAGHAEETLLNNLDPAEWQIESIGVTTNICLGCAARLHQRGMTLGGPASPYLANTTDFKLAVKSTK
jgi:hypothetical protein